MGERQWVDLGWSGLWELVIRASGKHVWKCVTVELTLKGKLAVSQMWRCG